MKTRHVRFAVILTFAIVAAAVPTTAVRAQEAATDPFVERGFSADRSYQFGGIDSVDLSTGTVSLVIPIGPRYPVGGILTYGLTLTYDSSVWDFESYVDGDGRPKTKAYLTTISNAGQGWRLSLGELFDPSGDDNPQPGQWVFVSSDGAQHSFKTELHYGETDDPTAWYTRDGTYLRMRFCGPLNESRCVGMPNGVVYTFIQHGADAWRLDTIEDPFGNWVEVAYDDVNHTETITDSLGRSHLVEFTDFTVDGETRSFVDRVSLMTFGDTTPDRSAVYEFDYTTHPFLPRSAKDDSPQTPDTVQAAVLSSLHLPEVPGSEPVDAGRYTLGYCLGLSCPGFSEVKDSPGMLKSVRYPTGGGVEWTYTTWLYSATVDDPGSPDPLDVLSINMEWAGVATKTLTDRSPANPSAVDVGTWEYQSWLVRPGPTYGSLAEERITMVTSPQGDDTAYYFRAMPRDIGGADDDLTEAWSYGLPFTNRVADPIADGETMYLSVEYYDGGTTVDTVGAPAVINGTKLRSEYVRYEHDEFHQAYDDGNYRTVNRYR